MADQRRATFVLAFEQNLMQTSKRKHQTNTMGTATKLSFPVLLVSLIVRISSGHYRFVKKDRFPIQNNQKNQKIFSKIEKIFMRNSSLPWSN